MSDCTSFRLLLDGPASGAWNMAVDEVLLEEAAQQESGCVRLYQWREPTLSLGYFQAYEERQQHEASRPCPAVRRLTGGGAILHDVELTYSIILPGRHQLALDRNRLYAAIHGCLIEALDDLGVSASLHCDCAQKRERPEPFLCFERRGPGDVLVEGAKIAGSAQRRRCGAVLQHGSVLLGRSAAAPELPGLAELTDDCFTIEVLTEVWLDQLAQRLATQWNERPLTDAESEHATRLAETRYGSATWTESRA